MSLTNYGEELLMNVFLTGTKYLSLHTTSPTETTSGVEVYGGGYSRKAIPFAPVVNGETTNNQLIQFPTATVTWGTVNSFGIWDAPVDGNLIWYGLLTDTVGNPAPKTVTAGDIFQVPVSDLMLRLE
jgi:hypothetical protein